jgi:hypothetical protein
LFSKFKIGHCVVQLRPLVVETGQYPASVRERIGNPERIPNSHQMSVSGQKAKYSLRAHRVRFAPESGLNSDIAPCPKSAIALNRYAVGSRPADREVARPRDDETRLLSTAFPMSALPRIATTERTCQHVSNGPNSDMTPTDHAVAPRELARFAKYVSSLSFTPLNGRPSNFVVPG